ncbi:MAG: glycosyl transferase [Bacteroidales bacterium]|nr:glycosyl transferase [Lachnoclostridium sp.]MCM1384726.1 glycosyl transferase [Lachnoclostridium sp.]MCM1465260.1 glycosyl transferase [Bacteroidales bacterium]
MKAEKLLKAVTDKDFRQEVLESRGFWNHLSDEEYLRLKFKNFFGYELDLDNPKTYCEKIQWLKLYNRNPKYTMMVDKYEVKKYVSDLIGAEHVIPLVGAGIYNSYDEIDFAQLPDQFVLKCTHNSGGFAVCKNKADFNIKAEKKNFDKMLKTNYFLNGREWPYKNVKPRILAEKYIDTLGNPDSVEYKVTCFDGKVGFITICQGPAHVEFWKRSNDHFTPDFEWLPWWVNYEHAKVRPEKPEQWDEMVKLAEKLSKDIPVVRVDFYVIDGKIYFGEFTFFTWSGFMHFQPEEWDRKLGDMIKLPAEKLEE